MLDLIPIFTIVTITVICKNFICQANLSAFKAEKIMHIFGGKAEINMAAAAALKGRSFFRQYISYVTMV